MDRQVSGSTAVVLVPTGKGHHRWAVVGESVLVTIDGLGEHIRIYFEWWFASKGDLR